METSEKRERRERGGREAEGEAGQGGEVEPPDQPSPGRPVGPPGERAGGDRGIITADRQDPADRGGKRRRASQRQQDGADDQRIDLALPQTRDLLDGQPALGFSSASDRTMPERPPIDSRTSPA